MRHGGNVWQGESPAQWLDYSANLRPEGAPEWVMAALQRGMENARYYPDPSMARARAALAEYLGASAENVLPTAGGISAIRLASCLESSETLLLTPCFCEYEQFASSPVRKQTLLGARHEVALPREIEIRKNSLVWLCNPMNPVGLAFSLKEVEGLLARVEEAQSCLAVDEAFIEYCPQNSAVSLLKEHDRLLITGSMTKILGIPGVRLGYLCASEGLLHKLKRHQLTWELSCFAESVALALPEHRREILRDSVCNARRREGLARALESLGVFVYPSSSACLLADFGHPVAGIVQELYEAGVLVRDCMSFDDIADGCHLRLAVKDEASNEKFIEILREVLSCAENH